jgi:hypothetical protein
VIADFRPEVVVSYEQGSFLRRFGLRLRFRALGLVGKRYHFRGFFSPERSTDVLQARQASFSSDHGLEFRAPGIGEARTAGRTGHYNS